MWEYKYHTRDRVVSEISKTLTAHTLTRVVIVIPPPKIWKFPRVPPAFWKSPKMLGDIPPPDFIMDV